MDKTYTNPVYPEIMADPFVFRHEGRYYAYGTAPGDGDSWRFPVLASTDLVNWERVGYALHREGDEHYWAPEVALADGKFYLYYSAGDIEGKNQRLRVAVGEHPAGPFTDCGILLVPDKPFSIDAHPFQDADGAWYLFYCVDFLKVEDDHRIGTGIVVDRMLDMTRLEGKPQMVARPHADWHLFLRQRRMYGLVVDWHTVEGPFVLRHDGRYFCFYSGGAWERENYGVSYVVADTPLGPYRRPEGVDTALLMSSKSGQVIGPGHNSFTVSPDGSQTWIVYHAWDTGMTGRRMCIDPLEWVDGQPRTTGPSSTPQPAPAGA